MTNAVQEDKQVRDRLQKIATEVDAQLPYGWGFVVLAFPFGADGRMNYVANAKRPDVVRAMYEFIQRSKEAAWGTHEADEMEAGSQAQDELVGRLRQQLAALEAENKLLRKAGTGKYEL